MADGDTLAEGWPVFSSDGQHLGHVKEIDAGTGWFKVDAPAAPDFWLPLDAILEQERGVALLKLSHNEVREQKWEGPEPRDTMLSPRGTRLDPSGPD
jgi:hypothetical protein